MGQKSQQSCKVDGLEEAVERDQRWLRVKTVEASEGSEIDDDLLSPSRVSGRIDISI